MNEYKSIAELAAELKVTRQTVYNKLKDKALSESVKPYIVKQGNFTFYTLQAQELIKQAIYGNSVKEDLTDCKKEFDTLSNELTDCKNNLTACKAEFDKVSKDLTACKNELYAKDKIINELNAKIADLRTNEKTVKALQSQLIEKSKDLEFCQNALDGANLEKNRNEIFYNSQKKALESKLSDKDNIIAELRAQIDGLRADKAFLQSQLTAKDTQLSEKDNTIKALTAEREQERKERQTILAELLQLRGQKAINVKAEPRPTGAATKQEPRAQERPHKKLSLREKLRAAADIFRK